MDDVFIIHLFNLINLFHSKLNWRFFKIGLKSWHKFLKTCFERKWVTSLQILDAFLNSLILSNRSYLLDSWIFQKLQNSTHSRPHTQLPHISCKDPTHHRVNYFVQFVWILTKVHLKELCNRHVLYVHVLLVLLQKGPD